MWGGAAHAVPNYPPMRPHVTGEETLCRGEYQQLSLLHWVDARGRARTWECSRRANARGAVLVVAVTPEREVLLTRQFRPPVNDFVIEFPAGLIDKADESPAEVAARELQEETGYRAGRLEPLIHGPVSPGMGSEYLWAYAAADLTPGESAQDDGEDIEILRVPVARIEQEMLDRLARGELIDTKIPGFVRLAVSHLGI